MNLTLKVKLTPAQIAEAFCELDDEAQAQFFIEVAGVASKWTGSFSQWFSVGRHLRDCACADDAARNVVRDIASGIEP